MSKLRDLSSKLASTTFWNQTTASSSDKSVGVTSTSSSLPATYQVEVQKLAAAQSIVSGQTFTSPTAAVGTGTLDIELGTWGAGQTTFASRTPAATVSITVDNTDTVESLRDKINASGAGVTASILTDSSGSRLVMRSKDSGEANAFRTTVTGGTGGLTSLGFDPSNGVTAATPGSVASNALATIDGVSVSSASNTLGNVLDGVSLTLTAETTAPVEVKIGNDTAAIKKTLEEFAAAYTEVNKLIATNTRYDATARTAGPLQGDGSIVAAQGRLRNLLSTSSTASSMFARMSDVGFELQRDGSLTVNATRMDNAVSNLAELRKFFDTSATPDPAAEGFARRFRTVADDLLNTDGTLTSRTNGLKDKLTRNQKSQDALDQRLTQTQKRLEKQYGALDTKLTALNGLSSYVSQQVTQWNKSS